LKNIVVRMPGPSWIAYLFMSKIRPVCITIALETQTVANVTPTNVDQALWVSLKREPNATLQIISKAEGVFNLCIIDKSVLL
jgi:hypothetical protein